MIEFMGEICEECKDILLREQSLLGFIVSTIIALFGIAVVLILVYIFHWWEILFFIFPFVLIVIIATTAPFLQKKHFLELISPQKIVIDQEQGYISVMMGKQANTFNKSLEAIKLVIDRGEWYYLKLRFPKIGGIICQKNLIVQGTIEEFETLFKNKIKEVK